MGLDHAGAGAGGRDEIIERLEGLDHLPGDRLCRLVGAAVVRGLAAAGLGEGDLDRAAGGLEQRNGGKPTLGRMESTRQVTKRPTRGLSGAFPCSGMGLSRPNEFKTLYSEIALWSNDFTSAQDRVRASSSERPMRRSARATRVSSSRISFSAWAMPVDMGGRGGGGGFRVAGENGLGDGEMLVEQHRRASPIGHKAGGGCRRRRCAAFRRSARITCSSTRLCVAS